MSTEQKVNHVRQAWEEGAPLEPALHAVELPRSTWYYHRNQKVDYEEKYQWLRPLVEKIIAENENYGVPRIKIELKEVHGHTVNHKVLRRLLGKWDLSLRRNVHKPDRNGVKSAIRVAGSSADLVTGRDQIDPFEVSVTDFTDIKYANGTRTAKLMSVIGHETKMAYGWAVARRRNSDVAIRAWEQAIETFEQLGISWDGMIVHHDRDSVYTGFKWLWRLLIEDNISISFAIRGAKDNTVMEAFNGTFKRENRSLFAEATNVEELRQVVEEQMTYYNQQRRHSSIGYISPATYIRRLRQREDQT